MLRWLCVLLLLVSTAAQADQTLRNYYDANQTTTGVNMYDTNGHVIDVHWGNIVQFGADQPIYWHGQASYCGWSPGNTGLPWCGIKTYKCANQAGGPDLLNCTDQGLLVDPASGPPFSTACAPVTSSFNGCWQAPMIHDVAHSRYVLYMECQCASSVLYYFFCTNPDSGCTFQGTVTLSHVISTGTPFVDDNGDIYYIYDVPGASNVYIDKLNSTGTAWDGVNTNTLGLASAEAPIIFKHGTNYVIGWGGLCGDCAGGGGLMVTITCANILTCSPSGNTRNMENTNNACFSQILTVAKIQAGGQTTWLYQGIKFNQQVANNNHGETEYYWQPLTFSSDQPQTFTCNATVTIPGITGSTYPSPRGNALLHPVADQTDLANNTFSDQFIYQVDNSHQWLQTFVPQSSQLYAIGFGLGFNAICSPSTVCSSINPGTAVLDVVSISSGCTINATLASSPAYTNANTGWASTWKLVPVNLTGLTIGGTYGLRLRASSVGTNMYWASPQIAQPPSVVAIPTPYSAGTFCQSSNSGASFTAVTNGSLMFETYPVAASVKNNSMMMH